MNNEYTAVVKQDGEWWIGWIEEVPGVNCQEATREELIESLRVTLREALDLNRDDALLSAGKTAPSTSGPRSRDIPKSVMTSRGRSVAISAFRP
jgi:predicted RNase H-like HicB family nuclease